MTLQEQMIQYRAKERITQQQLADRCGLSKQFIHLVESGQKNPSKLSLTKIRLVIGNEN